MLAVLFLSRLIILAHPADLPSQLNAFLKPESNPDTFCSVSEHDTSRPFLLPKSGFAQRLFSISGFEPRCTLYYRGRPTLEDAAIKSVHTAFFRKSSRCPSEVTLSLPVSVSSSRQSELEAIGRAEHHLLHPDER